MRRTLELIQQHACLAELVFRRTERELPLTESKAERIRAGLNSVGEIQRVCAEQLRHLGEGEQ